MRKSNGINESSISAGIKLRNLLLKFILTDSGNSPKFFAEWEKQVIWDDLDFQSFKLLSTVYPKLLEQNIKTALMTRIQSSYRRTWIENQLLLTALDDLFTALNAAQIKFIIADETIRLTQIYNDPGIYSLQNFSIIAPFSSKKEFCLRLIENLWQVTSEEFEKTEFCRDKTLQIQVLWVSEAEFARQIKNAELIQVKSNLLPVLDREEQILNLCTRDFTIFGEQESRWQLVAGKLIKSENIDEQKLVNRARERYLSFQLSEMLRKLNAAYDFKIPETLLTELGKIKKTGKLSVLKRKIQNLRQSYQMYLKYENESGAKSSFFKFLAKRWNSNSNAVFIKHLIRSTCRILQDD